MTFVTSRISFVSGAIGDAGTQIVGTRTAQSVGSSSADLLPPNVTISNTFTGAISGYNDVSDIAQDLTTLTLQAMASNAYAMNRVPQGSSVLPA